MIALRWDLEFHIHIDMSNLTVSTMLAQNPIEKCNQLIAHVFQLLNNAEKNYTTIEKEALAMVYAIYKYYHYLFGNKFFFNVDPSDDILHFAH